MTLNVLSLFAGIGGLRPLELGLERAGMTTVGQVELDAYCRRVLAKHWPCQPVSLAGRGNAQEDARWLWPAMADVIAQLRPAWVVGENVPGLRTRGLDGICADLGRLGYRVRVGELSACALGAPHARSRLFIVGHSAGVRCDEGRDHAPRVKESRRGGHVDQRSGWWQAEPDVDRVGHGVPARVDRLRALGNAVVPQVSEYVGRLIVSHAALSEEVA